MATTQAKSAAEKRFGIIDGEYTACYPVGVIEDEEEGRELLALCLPWKDHHHGAWTEFKLCTKNGAESSVRMSRVPVNQRKGLRKKVPPNWSDYLDFGRKEKYWSDALVAAYHGQVQNDLDESRIDIEPEESDGDHDETASTTRGAGRGR